MAIAAICSSVAVATFKVVGDNVFTRTDEEYVVVDHGHRARASQGEGVCAGLRDFDCLALTHREGVERPVAVPHTHATQRAAAHGSARLAPARQLPHLQYSRSLMQVDVSVQRRWTRSYTPRLSALEAQPPAMSRVTRNIHGAESSSMISISGRMPL